MAHCLHDVAGARLALGSDHGRALVDSAERLSEILGAAHERYVELGLVDVIHVVGGGEHFGLVDVIDLDGLKYLRLREVTDAALRHDRNGHGLLNAFYHFGIGHARNSACRADIRGNAFERHDRARARLFGYARLLGRGDVHDNAALEHLCEILVQFPAICHIYIPHEKKYFSCLQLPLIIPPAAALCQLFDRPVGVYAGGM